MYFIIIHIYNCSSIVIQLIQHCWPHLVLILHLHQQLSPTLLLKKHGCGQLQSLHKNHPIRKLVSVHKLIEIFNFVSYNNSNYTLLYPDTIMWSLWSWSCDLCGVDCVTVNNNWDCWYSYWWLTFVVYSELCTLSSYWSMHFLELLSSIIICCM